MLRFFLKLIFEVIKILFFKDFGIWFVVGKVQVVGRGHKWVDMKLEGHHRQLRQISL